MAEKDTSIEQATPAEKVSAAKGKWKPKLKIFLWIVVIFLTLLVILFLTPKTNNAIRNKIWETLPHSPLENFENINIKEWFQDFFSSSSETTIPSSSVSNPNDSTQQESSSGYTVTQQAYVDKYGPPVSIYETEVYYGCTLCGLVRESGAGSPTTYVVVANWNNIPDANNIPVGTKILIPIWHYAS